jgi:hypothetical protein
VLFLLDAASSLEEKLLRDWIARQRPQGAQDVDDLTIPASRRRRGRCVAGAVAGSGRRLAR